MKVIGNFIIKGMSPLAQRSGMERKAVRRKLEH